MTIKSKLKNLAIGTTKIVAATSNPVIGAGVVLHEAYKLTKECQSISKKQEIVKELKNMGHDQDSINKLVEMGYDLETKKFEKTRKILGGAVSIGLGLSVFKDS